MLKKKQMACSSADPTGDKNRGNCDRHVVRECAKLDTVDACALKTST
jgi:hypothetical protein